MNSGSNANSSRLAHQPSCPDLLDNCHLDDLQAAQVRGSQQLLFAPSTREVCAQVGLSWEAAVKLCEEDWLSFSPAAVERLDETQEAELRFLAALVTAGCDRRMMTTLLSGLSRPYAYDLSRVYYDWKSRSWLIIPDPHSHPETIFSDWIEMLVKSASADILAGIVELAQDALARLGPPPQQPELSPPGTWTSSGSHI